MQVAVLIQALLDKRKSPRTYLEIGCGYGETMSTFKEVVCEDKVGVDPALPKDVVQTEGVTLFPFGSDDFFTRYEPSAYDVVFIDGLHLFEQVTTDLSNAWDLLLPGGWVVIHDVLPGLEEIATRKQSTESWTGDCWKVIPWLREFYPVLEWAVVQVDCGALVIRKPSFFEVRLNSRSEDWSGYVDLPWSVFEAERPSWHELTLSDFLSHIVQSVDGGVV